MGSRTRGLFAIILCAGTLAALAAPRGGAQAGPGDAAGGAAGGAALPARIVLPAPRTTGGLPLLDALSRRRSQRNFADRMLPAQLLSDLLWAACGINRADTGKRTAPSARNWQEIELYVALPGGVYRYDAVAHALEPVSGGDLRAATGTQPYVAVAPVNFVYVAETSRMTGAGPEQIDAYAAADAAFIAQNVYLFCAAEGLATVVRASIDRPALAQALGLHAGQRIALAQTVGYPGADDVTR
ncbi:MAG: SagB/ThcOx family dehydrogenase [Candidatus Krumholzibacteriia bacterium]